MSFKTDNKTRLDRSVTFRSFIALIIVVCSGVAGCTRQQSTSPVDALTQPYMGHALKTIPEDSALKPEYSKFLGTSLRKLNIIDPIKDLDNNLKGGDKKFVGIYGISCAPPGLDENAKGNSFTADQRLEIALGVKCIEGTTDALPDDPQYLDLYQTAWIYAESYNYEYLRRIRKGLVN